MNESPQHGAPSVRLARIELETESGRVLAEEVEDALHLMDGEALLALIGDDARELGELLGTRPLPGLKRARLRFEGAHFLDVERSGKGTREVRVDGRLASAEEAEALLRVLGGHGEGRAAVAVHDARTLVNPSGDLGRDLARAFRLPPEGELERERAELARRRRRLEIELERVSGVVEDEPEAHVPPAVDDLLEAVDRARADALKLTERRLSLQDALKRLESDESAFLPRVPPAVLEDIEDSARRLQRLETALRDVGEVVRHRPALAWARLGGLVLVLAGLGFVGVGITLDDEQILRAGAGGALAGGGLLALLGAAFLGRVGVGAWKSKRLIAARDALREVARRRIARVGAPADLDELTAENLRRVVDRAARHETGLELAARIRPFVDDGQAQATLRRGARRLAEPLAVAARREANEDDDATTRAARAALQLASRWTRELEADRKAFRDRCRDAARLDVEREVLERTLEKTRLAERRLAMGGEAGTTGSDPRARLADRLQREVLPILKRLLGARAPERIADDLTPRRPDAPDASARALTTLVASLVLTDEDAPAPLVRLVVDPFAGLIGADERALAAWLASERAPANLVVVCTRARDARAAKEMMTGGEAAPASPRLRLVRESSSAAV